MKKIKVRKITSVKRSNVAMAVENAARAAMRVDRDLPTMVAEVRDLQGKLEHLHSSTTGLRVAVIGNSMLRRRLEDLEIEEEWFYGAMGRALQGLELYCTRNGLVIPAAAEEREKGGEE